MTAASHGGVQHACVGCMEECTGACAMGLCACEGGLVVGWVVDGGGGVCVCRCGWASHIHKISRLAMVFRNTCLFRFFLLALDLHGGRGFLQVKKKMKSKKIHLLWVLSLS